MLFDVDAMQTLYGGSNPLGVSPFPGIGAVGDTVRISLNGLGGNSAVLDASVVPEPTSALLLLGSGAMLLLRRRRAAV